MKLLTALLIINTGYESRFTMGNGSNYVQEDHSQNSLQETQNVRNTAGDGSDAASVDGKTSSLTHVKLNGERRSLIGQLTRTVENRRDL